ncbi:hydroxymethylglutaryl-CoA lyase [Vibrio sp. JPW-9-11-11]|uniref:hydroxymethylglutaryl-CoA lyase n=1 Tax=Vibrio sp. JPW-9-11-11 TaxID=1416532 RepID=UPI001592BE54|nr:hydroxymethylglutaryl-CoA lyase [Vibrio sp. JPW-9-11-11]NVD08060.1 hydroxymethylglutaryl-CoA lyase [Vibrio sp. JPW-9-11-11]
MNSSLDHSSLPPKVTIVEVGPRDGLQNEAVVSAQDKVEFIQRLAQSGLSHIECGAFVSAHRVPQMADSAQVFSALNRCKHVCYSALTPNLRGLEAAIDAGASRVAVFTSVSEGFCQRNIHCSVAESLKRFEDVFALADKHRIPVRGYLSCVIDCPYDGATQPQKVATLTHNMIQMGCDQVSLGDTVGTGTPVRVARMLDATLNHVPATKLAAHFHDTYGQALANLYQALSMGIHVIDSSTAGLGGCPYAKGAAGNVATEDVLYLCHGLGIETGVDIQKIVDAAWYICGKLNKQPASKVALARAPIAR